MKKLLSLFVIVCLVALPLVSCGGQPPPSDTVPGGYSQGLAYTVNATNPNECIITGIGSCTDKNIVIPTYIDGLRVTGIAEGAFSPKSELGKTPVAKRPTAMASAINIGSSGATENKIYRGSFSYETKGEGDTAGDGEPIALVNIESVQIPITVKEIGEEAFFGCEQLETINAPASLSTIGKDAFKETAYYNDPQNWDGQALYLSNYLITVMDNASGEFTVKEGTTMIADGAFYKCEYVTRVNFSSTLTYVGDAAFYGCTNLTYTSYLPMGNIQFGTNVFDGCVSYTPTFPGQGGVLVNPDAGVTPGAGTLFTEIRADIFENVKKNPPQNYTCIQIITEEHQGTVRTFQTDGVDSFYEELVDGDTVKELYSHHEEGVTIAYGRFGDSLYRTTATMPTPMGIPEELHFEDLVFITDVKGPHYTYVGGEGTSITFYFRDEALALMTIRTPEYDMEFRYSDLGTTEVPLPPLELLVPGVIVDTNGNPINAN